MSEILLKATLLEKRYGGLKAVSGVSVDVHRDEVHAVIGPNGAGKSTLINMLSGDVSVSSGAIMMGERDITNLAPNLRALAGVGRSYQKTTIFRDSTVFENVRLAAQAHGGQPLRLFGAAARDGNVNARAAAAIEEAGLSHRSGTVAKFMSHGEQRQLEIAMVLAGEPRVILLDEPLAGMGHAEAQRMIDLIGRLKDGRAVLLVEHDMDAVFALADRLTVMADGKLIASGTPEQVRNLPAVRVAYLGHEAGAHAGAAA
jgi:branched-chain amino acid transport system ATP-binding protein